MYLASLTPVEVFSIETTLPLEKVTFVGTSALPIYPRDPSTIIIPSVLFSMTGMYTSMLADEKPLPSLTSPLKNPGLLPDISNLRSVPAAVVTFTNDECLM